MAVVVEPVLTSEKLLSLLAEGHEQTGLDYKSQLDLQDKADLVELAKDVAAMQSEQSGGYIVIGADDHGKVMPGLTDQQAKLFDEAALRGMLKKYMAEPFEIHSTKHVLEGNIVILLYVAPHPNGWCVFTRQGVYEQEHPPGSEKKRSVTKFSPGDVFVRHGTASERWNYSDQERLLRQIIARRKEAWRAEIRDEFTGMLQIGRSAQSLEQMPTSALTWKLDAEGFDQFITELMRRDDGIPIRKLLLQAPAEASHLLASSESDDLSTLLDRVTSIGGLSLTYDQTQWFGRTVDCLVRLYELGFVPEGYDRTDMQVGPYWLQVIVRVYALGGLAVRMKKWSAIKTLADRAPEAHDFSRHYGSWLRHAVTKAARADMFADPTNDDLLARARTVAQRVQATRLDVAANDERILSSLCQFDAYGALVVIGERHDSHASLYYPNFARYYAQRTLPAFKQMVTNQEVRRQLFEGDDALLALALADIERMAQQESFRFNGFDGIDDDRVKQFITANLPTEPSR
ncbi:ATP-binding protein [Spirillospora sp. NPDC000708]